MLRRRFFPDLFNPSFLERIMELASLFGAINGPWVDDALVWGVAALTGVIGLVALVNAVDMFLDAEAG